MANSGTEANELAMLTSQLYSGNLEKIALRNAYHGGNAATIGLTCFEYMKLPHNIGMSVDINNA